MLNTTKHDFWNEHPIRLPASDAVYQSVAERLQGHLQPIPLLKRTKRRKRRGEILLISSFSGGSAMLPPLHQRLFRGIFSNGLDLRMAEEWREELVTRYTEGVVLTCSPDRLPELEAQLKTSGMPYASLHPEAGTNRAVPDFSSAVLQFWLNFRASGKQDLMFVAERGHRNSVMKALKEAYQAHFSGQWMAPGSVYSLEYYAAEIEQSFFRTFLQNYEDFPSSYVVLAETPVLAKAIKKQLDECHRQPPQHVLPGRIDFFDPSPETMADTLLKILFRQMETGNAADPGELFAVKTGEC